MRLKLKAVILSLTLFTFLFTINGCVDEPVIDPAYRLNSVIRVVNVTNNLNNIRVTLTDQPAIPLLNAMPIGSTTEYFDIPAGSKMLTVADESGQTLFSKDINAVAFQVITFVLSGNYSADADFNTLNLFEVEEGESYVSHAPEPGKSLFYFVHASTDVDTFATRPYTVAANINDGSSVKDTVYNPTTPLPYGEYISASAVPGAYTISLLLEDGTTVKTFDPREVSPNLLYFVYIYGNPNDVQLFINETAPPAVRTRD